jgi:hypothetical protein
MQLLASTGNIPEEAFSATPLLILIAFGVVVGGVWLLAAVLLDRHR